MYFVFIGTILNLVSLLFYSEIAVLVDTSTELQLRRRRVFLHKAFKLAVKDVLSELKTSKQIILIHGVPKIGKSLLAESLAYYLALESGSATYIDVDYKSDTDGDRAVQGIEEYRKSDTYVILDQCNVNVLNRERLLHSIRTATSMKPLIIFTSGKYIPHEEWMIQDHPVIRSKVISMRVDREAIEQLRKSYSPYYGAGLKTEDVFKLSRKYGVVVDCLLKWEDRAINGESWDFELMKEILYECRHMISLHDRYKVFYVIGPAGAAAAGSEEAIAEALGDCLLKPVDVKTFGLKLRLHDVKDSDGINLMLNWLDVRDWDGGKEEDLYSSYCGSSYVYYVQDILKPAVVRALKHDY